MRFLQGAASRQEVWQDQISIGTEMSAFSGEYPPGSVWERFFQYPFDTGYATVGEVIGNAKLIPDEFKVLHDQGRFVMRSSPRDKTEFDFHDLCNRASHTIIGAHNFSHPKFATYENPWTMERHCEQFFDLVADGELDVKRMISHRVSYKDAPEIYCRLFKDRSQYMGIVNDCDGVG
jgi:threonine dehydrogenase-like Zn-dependent dehydrogenase